jgi:hypothetical protein
LRCDTALHQCVQCGNDGDCTGGLVCEKESHTCVVSCADGGACPAGTQCDPRGYCVGCTTDADCATAATGHVCDPNNGHCVQCVSDTQCSYPTPHCNRANDTCVQCLYGSQCDDGACDPATHTCVGGSDE